MDDDKSNWYEKLAKSGWLGTKAQVSAQYGKPTWSSENDDSYGKALTNIRNKVKQTPEGADNG